MAILIMQRNKTEKGEAGSVYYQYLELTAGVSDTYILPPGIIYAVGVNITDGNIYFTMDSESKIYDLTANWVAWDGESRINPAVTGWYVEWVANTTFVGVTVKTNKV